MEEPSREEERKALFEAVGLALDQWSHVEDLLDLIVAEILGTTHGRAHTVMASIVNFRTRLQICNNLIEREQLSPAFKQSWKTLYNLLSRQNDRRNELAHFSVVDLSRNGRRVGCRLIPYFKVVTINEKQTELTAKDIEERAALFSGLVLKLHGLREQLQSEQREGGTSGAH